MSQFRLTKNCLFRDNSPFRKRSKEESLREFLMSIINEFYVGEEYRFSAVDDLGLACLATTAVGLHHRVGWSTIPPQQRALVFATRSGSLVTDQDYQHSLNQGGRTSARVFVQTLPNMPAGQVAACFALKGEHYVLVQDKPDFSTLENISSIVTHYGNASLCLITWMELTDNKELNVEMTVRQLEKEYATIQN